MTIYPIYANSEEDKSISSFSIWADPEVILNQGANLQGWLCTPYLPSTYGEWQSPIVTVNYYIKGINGEAYNYTDNNGPWAKDEECSSVAQSGGYTLQVGQYSVYAVASWISDGVAHNATSNHFVYEVKQGLFQDAKITKISDTTLYLKDWSSDGSIIVAQAPDGTTLYNSRFEPLAVLDIPGSLENVNPLYISRNNDQLLFTANHAVGTNAEMDMYTYDIRNKSAMQLTNNTNQQDPKFIDLIIGGAWLDDGNLVYIESRVLREDIYAHRPSSLWLADSEGRKIERVLGVDEEIFSIDLNPNGNKLLMLTSRFLGGSYPYYTSKLLIFDLDTHKLSEVPHEFGCCIGNVRWAANSDMILYQVHNTGPGIPGGALRITSTDAKFDQPVFSSINTPSSALVSPDGSRLLFSGGVGNVYDGKVNLYELEFSHPMPEFSEVATMLILSSMFAAFIIALGVRVRIT